MSKTQIFYPFLPKPIVNSKNLSNFVNRNSNTNLKYLPLDWDSSCHHEKDEEVNYIYQRYHSGLCNLFDIYIPIVDYWALYDNNLQTKLIADSESIRDLQLFNKIKEDHVRTR